MSISDQSKLNVTMADVTKTEDTAQTVRVFVSDTVVETSAERAMVRKKLPYLGDWVGLATVANAVQFPSYVYSLPGRYITDFMVVVSSIPFPQMVGRISTGVFGQTERCWVDLDPIRNLDELYIRVIADNRKAVMWWANPMQNFSPISNVLRWSYSKVALSVTDSGGGPSFHFEDLDPTQAEGKQIDLQQLLFVSPQQRAQEIEAENARRVSEMAPRSQEQYLPEEEDEDDLHEADQDDPEIPDDSLVIEDPMDGLVSVGD